MALEGSGSGEARRSMAGVPTGLVLGGLLVGVTR